jgi:hypothetical protein
MKNKSFLISKYGKERILECDLFSCKWYDINEEGEKIFQSDEWGETIDDKLIHQTVKEYIKDETILPIWIEDITEVKTSITIDTEIHEGGVFYYVQKLNKEGYKFLGNISIHCTLIGAIKEAIKQSKIRKTSIQIGGYNLDINLK